MGRIRTLLAATLIGGSLVLAACGGDSSSDEDAVAAVAEQFAQAGAANDYATFCDLLAEGARAQIEESDRSLAGDVPEEERCTAILEAVETDSPQPDTETEVTDVQVDGDTAQADVTNTFPDIDPVSRTLQMQKQESGEWLIVDYGGP